MCVVAGAKDIMGDVCKLECRHKSLCLHNEYGESRGKQRCPRAVSAADHSRLCEARHMDFSKRLIRDWPIDAGVGLRVCMISARPNNGGHAHEQVQTNNILRAEPCSADVQ